MKLKIMKLKTRKWIAKRTTITWTWKIKIAKANRRHLLSNKSSKAKNRFKYWRILKDKIK